jgi:acetate kinase
MSQDRLILITNPGSSSRKYALYLGKELLCNLHFEFEDGIIVYTLKKADGTEKKIKTEMKSLTSVIAHLEEILTAEGYLGGMNKIDVILARVVAPGEYFSHDHIVDAECLKQLEIAKERAPLHVPVVANEIEHFISSFKGTPVVILSDSEYHNSRPALTKAYAIDQELANKYDIKRWGFHGLSVSSVVRYMKSQEILPEKLIVCHIGSGASVTAVYQGKSHDTTMGYTPLDGLMMATRAGHMDVAAALALKRALNYQSDESLEKYLNKESGLLGVSGQSDDMRDIIRLRDEGDPKGTFAHALFIYRIQAAIGEMAASLGGVDAIVFTATIGERSDDVRRMVTQKLAYLGFALDEQKNIAELTERHANIAADGSKPVYIVKTDETAEMIEQASALLDESNE